MVDCKEVVKIVNFFLSGVNYKSVSCEYIKHKVLCGQNDRVLSISYVLDDIMYWYCIK